MKKPRTRAERETLIKWNIHQCTPAERFGEIAIEKLLQNYKTPEQKKAEQQKYREYKLQKKRRRIEYEAAAFDLVTGGKFRDKRQQAMPWPMKPTV